MATTLRKSYPGRKSVPPKKKGSKGRPNLY